MRHTIIYISLMTLVAAFASCSHDDEADTLPPDYVMNDSVVTIIYDGPTATVQVPAFITGVTAVTDGAHVSITSANTTDEIVYIARGSSADGSLTINGSYKLTLALCGLDLASTRGAAIDIQCGKRTAVVLAEETDNRLSDGAAGTQKACLYSKGHVEISGSGSLTVSGNRNHAIATKEYLQLKRSTGTLTIASSVNDAIHAGQYFQMNGGTLTIGQRTLGDGIQAERTGRADHERDGQIIIKGGTLDITTAGMDAKAIKADTDIAISGGTLTITASGNGSRGIQTPRNMVVGQEDGTTRITVSATGTKCTKPDCAADPHNCMGIKVDGNLTVNAGTVAVDNSGAKSKGIKVGGTYTLNGGTVNATIEQ